MSLRLIEGFDNIATGTSSALITGLTLYRGWFCSMDVQGSSQMVQGPGRFGTGRFIYPTYKNNSYFVKYLSATGWSGVVCGFACRFDVNIKGGYQFFMIRNTIETNNCGISANLSTRKLSLHNAAGTVVGTSTVDWKDGWNYVEVKVTVGASGSASVHLNAVEAIAPTVSNYATYNAAGPMFYHTGNDTTWYNYAYDDIYFLDTGGIAPCNDFLGDVRVETIFPTADGATSGWTQDSGGNHFSRVADTSGPDGDTSYVKAESAGLIDTYTHGDIAATNAVIYGVQHNLIARKTDAGTRTLKAVVRQGGADVAGSVSHALASSYTFYQQLWEQNPVTSNNWLLSEINADEFGVEVAT